MTVATPFTGVVTEHGEGPVWFGPDIGLRVVDMLAGDILTIDASGEVERNHVGKVAAVVRPRTGGGFVVATERGFALHNGDDVVSTIGPLWTDHGVRMNEGGCDPDGRFYAGTMAYYATPGSGSLYRLDPDGSVENVLEGVTISNGLEWSPSGENAYYVDSPTGRIDVFDYTASDGFQERRPFVTIDRQYGDPDGLTVDREGGVWVAMWGGNQVRRYDPDGHLSEVIDVPIRQVTACTFGGADLDTLYITTSALDDGFPIETLAGAVFANIPGVTGMKPREFGG